MTDDWEDAFSSPNTPVGVSTETPAWVGTLTRSEPGGPTTLSPEGFTLAVSEMSDGEASAWARGGDGWVAFCSRARMLAELLGGQVVTESFRNNRTLEERHQLTYIGKAVDL